MASFKHAKDLNDAALKPRLLRSVVNDQLPTETAALPNPGDIASIVAVVKTHRLLSGDTPSTSSADSKLLSSWNSAFDAWLHRILLLSHSPLPDKCWAGVCLLGITCAECSSERFLASFSDWFNIFVQQIQQSGIPQIVRVASCSAVSDLMTRLGGLSNVKKDGTTHAGRLVQLILKMLNEDATEELLEVTSQLLCTVLTYFPSSVHRYHESVEAAIVSKILSGRYGADLLKKLSCCLALLPKSRADEESWSLMMQKILLTLDTLLDTALEGLEEESRRREAVTLLVPPGKDSPQPLGGQKIEENTLGNGERSQQFVISTITCLVQCCCSMLTTSYPVQVAVPIRPLLALIGRVLRVNGSLPEAMQPFTTAMQQELVCLQLPVLHSNMLDILAAVVKGLRSQLLPHAADIVWLLIHYFDKCLLPELRTQVYKVFRSLLISMGAGMSLYISQDVIHYGSIDLKVTDSGSDKELSSNLSSEVSSQHRRKKRKQGGANEPLVQHQASVISEVEGAAECQASISLKIAAIEALEAVIIVGGALRSESWRSEIDLLLMEVVTNACKGDKTHGGKPFLAGRSGAACEDLQLAALRAFLASLLSPGSTRPPYLAQGLELFHKGAQQTGSKVAEFCAQALMALEVLIHPRALPLVDVTLPTGNSCHSWRMDFDGSKYNSAMDSRVHGVYPDVYDVQDYANIEDAYGSEIPAIEAHTDGQNDGKLMDISKDRVHEETNIVDGSSDKLAPIKRDEDSEPKDMAMLDVQHQEPDTSQQAGSRNCDAMVLPESAEFTSGVPTDNSIGSTAVAVSSVAATADINFLKHKSDNGDDSSDPFPEIEDVDPDTESDC